MEWNAGIIVKILSVCDEFNKNSLNAFIMWKNQISEFFIFIYYYFKVWKMNSSGWFALKSDIGIRVSELENQRYEPFLEGGPNTNLTVICRSNSKY
jgi:hypothetical protein